MFRQIERFWVPALVVGGYVWVTIGLRDYISNIPIVYPALLISIFAYATSHFLPKIHSIVYWLMFSLFVFQLVSIHENDICIRKTCHTTDVQKYIALASTGLTIVQATSKSSKSKPKKKVTQIPVAEAVPIQSVKLKFEPNNTNVKWV